MIIKLSLALSSNRLQNLALPQHHQPPCPLSVLSDGVTGDSPLCIVYIIPQHNTLLAYGNLNGHLLLPSLLCTLICNQLACGKEDLARWLPAIYALRGQSNTNHHRNLILLSWMNSTVVLSLASLSKDFICRRRLIWSQSTWCSYRCL